MARFIPMDLLKSLTGKICGHSDTYFATKNGTMYTGTICNPYTGDPTANQLAQRTLFKNARTAMSALTEQEKSAYQTAFKASPGKYTTLNGYIFAKEMAKLKGAGN